MKIKIKSLAELPVAAAAIAKRLTKHPVVAFHGAMGAGKTTLIRAIAAQLGVAGEVTSPTFAIVNQYTAASGQPICHFDFYRIESVAEALDIGTDEYLESGAICLIEWPENTAALLPPDTLHIHITTDPENPEAREIEVG